MKKVLCFILTFIMFATAVFAEVSGEIGYSESAKNVYIAGDLSKAEVTSGKTVTLMLTDKTTGDVKYVDQLTVDENKKYETKFKFAEDMSNCELSVKEGDTTLCQPYRDYFSTSSSNYASRYYKAENWAKLRTQEQEARDAAKPVQRTVVIEKVQ